MSHDPNRPFRGLFGSSPPPPNYTDNSFSGLLKALVVSATKPTPLAGGLGAFFGKPTQTAQSNTLSGLLGLPVPALPLPLPTLPQVRRKVFFSFYYNADIRRSCIVRNSYRIRPGRKLPASNFYDRSLWESSKRVGEESLKQLIRSGMVGSSVTCVLAGTHTWQRSWVRYEIARSLVCGNGLFTVYINNVRDPRDGFASPGYNPLDFMGLQLRADGRGNICEMVEGKWLYFALHKAPVRWPRWLQKPQVGYLFPLSQGARAYDYHFDDGYDGLSEWAQLAAADAGRS